jgi:hypothetical protein
VSIAVTAAAALAIGLSVSPLGFFSAPTSITGADLDPTDPWRLAIPALLIGTAVTAATLALLLQDPRSRRAAVGGAALAGGEAPDVAVGSALPLQDPRSRRAVVRGAALSGSGASDAAKAAEAEMPADAIATGVDMVGADGAEVDMGGVDVARVDEADRDASDGRATLRPDRGVAVAWAVTAFGAACTAATTVGARRWFGDTRWTTLLTYHVWTHWVAVVVATAMGIAIGGLVTVIRRSAWPAPVAAAFAVGLVARTGGTWYQARYDLAATALSVLALAVLVATARAAAGRRPSAQPAATDRRALSTRTDLADQSDVIDRMDVSGRFDGTDRVDVSGRVDSTARMDVDGRLDGIGRTGVADQLDVIGRGDVVGRIGAGGRAGIQGRGGIGGGGDAAVSARGSVGKVFAWWVVPVAVLVALGVVEYLYRVELSAVYGWSDANVSAPLFVTAGRVYAVLAGLCAVLVVYLSVFGGRIGLSARSVCVAVAVATALGVGGGGDGWLPSYQTLAVAAVAVALAWVVPVTWRRLPLLACVELAGIVGLAGGLIRVLGHPGVAASSYAILIGSLVTVVAGVRQGAGTSVPVVGLGMLVFSVTPVALVLAGGLLWRAAPAAEVPAGFDRLVWVVLVGAMVPALVAIGFAASRVSDSAD